MEISNDDRVYVADRSGRRVQAFTLDGRYLGQVFVNRAQRFVFKGLSETLPPNALTPAQLAVPSSGR